MEYAGPMPARGLYRAWALKREAFEFLTIDKLRRQIGGQ